MWKETLISEGASLSWSVFAFLFLPSRVGSSDPASAFLRIANALCNQQRFSSLEDERDAFGISERSFFASSRERAMMRSHLSQNRISPAV